MDVFTLVWFVAVLVYLAVVARTRRRELQRFAQLTDLCHAQQRWIRRGEVACVDCPELGSCIVRGACEREAGD